MRSRVRVWCTSGERSKDWWNALGNAVSEAIYGAAADCVIIEACDASTMLAAVGVSSLIIWHPIGTGFRIVGSGTRGPFGFRLRCASDVDVVGREHSWPGNTSATYSICKNHMRCARQTVVEQAKASICGNMRRCFLSNSEG